MADLIIYNGSDKVIKRIVELLNQGGGGGGLVDDVKVNGTSVVDANKVAQIDLTPYAESADLATVATTGDYDDLQNKPTIPAAQVQSDWLEADTSAKSYIQNKPTIPSAQVNSDWNASSGVAEILNKPNLATVATSGSYTDLTNKPTIPPTLTASGNIEIDSNIIKRKEVWLNSVAEYEALANPDPNTDYHVPSVTFGLLPITVVNGKICCHYTKEV